ncbi:MAG: MlaE family lipid ABC transporter permease subunit [Gammaproteobacteria bacterium]|nr:MlaE family lipid ABC transporter permease subunit [Gammaproteobacteria bacterium]
MVMEAFVQYDHATHQYICQGDWVLSRVPDIKKQLKFLLSKSNDLTFDGAKINKMDSAGVWLLVRWLKESSAHERANIHLKNFSDHHQQLISLIEQQTATQKKIPHLPHHHWIYQLGDFSYQQFSELKRYLAFVGQLTYESIRIISHPVHVRWRAFLNVIDTSGYQALPIIALLSFMVGIVIAYQMALQLRNYGANIYIVDFLGLSILREFGPLLTAIMVAGRTGAAFTAQLGTMKINQEIDALNTMGVTPAELLILPRIVGLVVALPLLTIWSDIFGLIGGMIMAHNMLGISTHDFLLRFQQNIPLRTLLIGIGKAPVFALLISSIGCFQGMEVRGSADSVGKRTTRSVVLAIFYIIVADAIFSVLFSKFNL